MCRFMRELATLAMFAWSQPGITFRGTELLRRCHINICIHTRIHIYLIYIGDPGPGALGNPPSPPCDGPPHIILNIEAFQLMIPNLEFFHISNKLLFWHLRGLGTLKIGFPRRKKIILRYSVSLGVENMSFYVFVGAPTGPDPRRAPPGPRGGPH